MTQIKFDGEWHAGIVANLEDAFLQECVNICHDKQKLLNFKRNNIFCKVIGNDIRRKDISDVWYNFLENTELMEDIAKYKNNDAVGNPLFYSYEKTGMISPGTLCFLSVLQDIKTRLVDPKGKRVCEIGSGYGGQANIILKYGVKSMDLIDRPQTLALAKKYLSLYKHSNVSFHNTESIEAKEYDLVVSNWCLSELDRKGMQFYIDNVIKTCNHGYFLINFRDESKQQWMIDELSKNFSKVILEEENPPTNEIKNYVLLCSK